MRSITKEQRMRFILILLFSFGGSFIINRTSLKPKGYRSNTVAYVIWTIVTLGVYWIVGAYYNLRNEPGPGEKNWGYIKDEETFSSYASNLSKPIKSTILIADIAILIGVISCFAFCSIGGKGGDGITTCKNCGKEEVVLFGMCGRCADGFLDWHDKLD